METRYKPKPHHSSGRSVSNPPPMHLLTKWTAALQQPFVGVTTDGEAHPELFKLERTGLSPAPIAKAAQTFLESLTPAQREETVRPMDSLDWRTWSNYSGFLFRHGLMLDDMTPAQRERAFGLLEATLSAEAYALARDLIRINETVAEICNDWGAFGENLYWMSVFGDPGGVEPWGWQIDGHHVVMNCVVIGDQVVLSPVFMGAEPVFADAGRYQGLRVYQKEEAAGFAVMQALTPGERQRATFGMEIPFDTFASCFTDNYLQERKGVCYTEMPAKAQALLLDLVAIYAGRLRPEYAAVRMEEVKRHLDDTWFAWIGGHGEADPFYYQIYSPVILVEFDHQKGLALLGDQPTRDHAHSVMRTPNGNDYGFALLAQYYAKRGIGFEPPKLVGKPRIKGLE